MKNNKETLKQELLNVFKKPTDYFQIMYEDLEHLLAYPLDNQAFVDIILSETPDAFSFDDTILDIYQCFLAVLLSFRIKCLKNEEYENIVLIDKVYIRQQKIIRETILQIENEEEREILKAIEIFSDNYYKKKCEEYAKIITQNN